MNLKKFLCSISFFVFSCESFASTKIFLHNANSKLGLISRSGAGYGCANGSNNYTYRAADTSQGTSAVTYTYIPTTTAPPCRMQTASGGGDYLMWASSPISSQVTISGNIDYRVYCKESVSGPNFGVRFVIYRWSVAKGGIVSTLQTSSGTSECPTTIGLMNIAAAAPTSTTFQVGDRIVIIAEAYDAGGWGADGVITHSLAFDGLTAATGDTWVNFVDNISFSADSANAAGRVQ